MLGKQNRRSVLKKIAATGIASGVLLGSSGSAAAANNSYKIIVEHDGGSNSGEYEFTVDDGGDGGCSVSALDGSMESTDSWYSEADGSITVNGDVSSSDTYDKYQADGAGELTVNQNRTNNCTVYKQA